MAAELVWFDALVTNLDRTARNPNLLVWNRRPWLIDHGAALYAHHNWSRVDEGKARTDFPLIRDHVLLTRSGGLDAADARLAPRVTQSLLGEVLAAVPDVLLMASPDRDGFADAAAARRRYMEYMMLRMRSPRMWVARAIEAKRERLARPPSRLEARR